MTEQVENFVVQALATLAGACVAIFVAKLQARNSLAIEEKKHMTQKAFEFLGAIDLYLNQSFRGEEMDRQLSAKRVLTLSAIVAPSRFSEIEQSLSRVENHHYNRKFGGARPSATFKMTREFFNEQRASVFKAYFGQTFVDTTKFPDQVSGE